MGRKNKNLIGQEFEKLRVIEETDERRNGHILWKCECICGKIVFVTSSNLRNGSTKSCGCYKKEINSKKRIKDLTDQQFGNLKVVEKTDGRHRGYVIWKCKCVCGRTVCINTNSLQSGNTRSCGCLHKEQVSKANTTHGLSKTVGYKTVKARERRELSLIYDFEWTLEMELALKEFQPACILCGSTERLCVDHVFPLSKGYGLKPGNAVILCNHHNSTKQAQVLEKLPEEISDKIKSAAKQFKNYWESLIKEKV